MIQMIANRIPQVFIKEWVRNYDTRRCKDSKEVIHGPSHEGFQCECKNKSYITINVNDTTQKILHSEIMFQCRAQKAFLVKAIVAQGRNELWAFGKGPAISLKLPTAL